jgi:hypothetical protein
MSGEPHLWEGMVDIREISIETFGDEFQHVLLKMDGKNNKTGAREQIQFHLSEYTFENLVEGINRVIGQYKELKEKKIED